ncbi:rhomboid family intramembrane serine protease [Paracoccus sp. 1_MG-2023]|uniref:rhomboid family intramembrane serine protease n=1 Tax=unclassified Paracoccus (in: a-proteobacteria) TaxID=2688777 RepID=UPI001C0800D2|nr:MULTISPECIES: rhomboid family intramembrane serine protease [unclassified Paracoccus (in: a-proteobacteria)]MBU2956767.1 rhomboid family intramembrane serine protease [Paracoccus sp. C2R09]MDO6669194.1 rhomboid family intramembrane serine protease [Paracoccus sp. 1_MG-2023]
MRPGLTESPLNPLPPVIWLLALPVIASEAIFALGGVGLIGGAEGVGLRLGAINMTALPPELIQRAPLFLNQHPTEFYRLFSFSFVHTSLTHALFVAVFTLALGNLVAQNFRPWAVVALFLGSAIGGAVIYSVLLAALGLQNAPVIGGYPAVYGLVGAFTFLLWTRLAAANANRMRAFSLIGMLLVFQLAFGLVFGGAGLGWIAEVAGFATGFLLSFGLVDGGMARALRQIRQR